MKSPTYPKYLTPSFRRDRFFDAIWNCHHKVTPLWPGSCRDYTDALLDLWDKSFPLEEIEYLQDRGAEVGFPSAVNEVLILEVRSANAQARVDKLNVGDTPRDVLP